MCYSLCKIPITIDMFPDIELMCISSNLIINNYTKKCKFINIIDFALFILNVRLGITFGDL